MTFDGSEASRYGGAPVECFRFAYGDDLYLLTSGDAETAIPQGVFQPLTMSRSEIDQSQESGAGGCEVRVPHDCPLALIFAASIPESTVSVTIYRGHRDELANAVPIFFGVVGSYALEGSEAVLTCQPFGQVLKRTVPCLSYQIQCNRCLYGAGCNVAMLMFRDTATVATVSGSTVTSATFDARADGWYRNGWLTNARGEMRMIVAHVGDTLTLMHPFADLVTGDTVYAQAGCDRTEATCTAKFSNLVNHLGWARVPSKNPFASSVS